MKHYKKELAEYFKISEREVSNNLSVVTDKLKDSWEAYNGNNIEFHKNSEWIIYRMMRDRPKVDIFLREIITLSYARDDKAILDFGAGVGSYAIPLATIGLDVTAVEVKGSKVGNFLKWRIDKRELDVTLWDHDMPIDKLELKDKFDAILFYDVLEHLSNPFETLRKIHCALKPKGMLYMTYSPHGDMTNVREIEKGCLPLLEKYFYRFDHNKWQHR